MERTTLYLYRGVIVLWCATVPEQGTCTFTTTWEIGDRWHWSDAYTDLEPALAEACIAIDRCLAIRPSSIVHQPSGRMPNIDEHAWSMTKGF